MRIVSAKMAYAEIDVKGLRTAIKAVLDHLVEDLGLEKIEIDQSSDFYWDCPAPEMYNVSRQPAELDVGRLSDDVDFVRSIKRGQSFDASYNLVHIAPLLRYIAEKVKK